MFNDLSREDGGAGVWTFFDSKFMFLMPFRVAGNYPARSINSGSGGTSCIQNITLMTIPMLAIKKIAHRESVTALMQVRAASLISIFASSSVICPLSPPQQPVHRVKAHS